MYLRVTIALILAVLLAGTHWRAYVAGQGAVRAELTAKALKTSEAAREREQDLRATVENQDRELQKQKARNAAISRANDDRLREYQAAIDRANKDACTSSGVDGPFAKIASECGSAIAQLDKHARGMEATARALQEYASGVCVGR